MTYILTYSLYFIVQNLIYYICRVNISFVLRNIFLLIIIAAKYFSQYLWQNKQNLIDFMNGLYLQCERVGGS